MNTTWRWSSPRLVSVTVLGLAMSGGVLTACGTETPEAGVAASHEMHAMTSPSNESRTVVLHSAMRTLWAQHMEWTYATVVAFAGGTPALDASVSRLLRNQVDIGHAIRPYYGRAAAHRLTRLLTVHIQDAVPVLTAAKAGDTTALDQAVRAWYANARDIADFLASANPHWKRHAMRQMMHAHITQTLAYAGDVLTGRDAAAVAAYDVAEAHMTEMADMLSDGIVRQFPRRF